MRIMYIAPRYHTNQTDIIRGWHRQGDQVLFVAHYKAPIEDYQDITPVVLGYSVWYELFDRIYVKLNYHKNMRAIDLRIKAGFPSRSKLAHLMNRFEPDLVIMRERSLYSVVAFSLCRKYGYKAVLYNQSPLWDKPYKDDFWHRLIKRHTPRFRMTPVMGLQNHANVKDPDAFFVPFVKEPGVAPRQRTYFQNDRINILEVGKFEPRKNHIMLMQTAWNLSEKYKIHVTIIGEATGIYQKQHYQEVIKFRDDNHLQELIDIHINVPHGEMKDWYEQADLFVMPSTEEMASVSQLEAMAYAVPVICSDTNGSACYVDNGKSGYLFQNMNQADLQDKMEKMLSEREQILKMGNSSYYDVCEKYGFANYCDVIMQMIKLQ